MGVFQQFPYTNFHEMNLDEIIRIVKQLADDWVQYQQQWGQLYEDTEQALQDFKDYVQQYFDTLDLQDEVNTKINQMVSDGTFDALIVQDLSPVISSWLSDHITQPSTPAIDTSLTVAGAAADAKAAGDSVRNLQSMITETYYNKFNKYAVTNGKTVLDDGTITNGVNYDLSDLIPTTGESTIFAEWSGQYFQFRIALYDSNEQFIQRLTSSPLSAGKGVYTLNHTGYIRVILQSSVNPDGQSDRDTFMVIDGRDILNYVPYLTAVDYKERDACKNVTSVHSFTNMFDESDINNIRTGGFYGSGGWTPNANFNTLYIPIEAYKTYFTNTPSQAIGVCDASKTFLAYVPTDANGRFYTSVPNAAYAGVAFKADLSNRGKQMFVSGKELPAWYLRPNIKVLYDDNAKAYFENTIWRGKSWYSFGTSMEDINPGGTSGNVGTNGKWPLYVDGVSGMIRNNQAVGGGGICPSTSGRGLVKARVLACPYDVDLVTIEAGPNDWTEITLGEVGDIGDDTFLGNLRQCYEYLTEHTRARVVSICISNSNDNGGRPFYVNQFGYTYRDYMNGVRELSKYYGITNIDVAGDLLGYGRRTEDMLKDHIHYTELGGSVVGEFIWNKLKTVEPFPRFLKEEANL